MSASENEETSERTYIVQIDRAVEQIRISGSESLYLLDQECGQLLDLCNGVALQTGPASVGGY